MFSIYVFGEGYLEDSRRNKAIVAKFVPYLARAWKPCVRDYLAPSRVSSDKTATGQEE